MTSLTIKRGETFSPHAAYVDDAGDPVDLTSYTIASQVRKLGNAGDLVTDLDIVLENQDTDPGTFALSADDTSLWPIGLLACDVRLEVGGIVTFTDTFSINVVAAVTR